MVTLRLQLARPSSIPTNWKRYTLQQRGCKVQKKRRNGWYTPEFQQYAVERMRVAINISALAKELGVLACTPVPLAAAAGSAVVAVDRHGRELYPPR